MKILMKRGGSEDLPVVVKKGARGPNQLTVAELRKKLREPGLHTDGGGLYLRVGADGRQRSWIAVFHLNGKRREMGLGSADKVTLARAREKAAEIRSKVADGIDPIAAKRATRAIPTFGELADEFIAERTKSTGNDKSVARWKRALGDGKISYAKPMRDKRVDLVDTDDVLSILRPIWHDKATTARNVRSYIERVLDAAKARKFRAGENPARFKGHLDALLAGDATSKKNVKHHAAMPWQDVPDFVLDLRKRPALSARALEFTILTAARTGETIGATWGELDLEAGTWTVPAGRMKAGAEHVVPLPSVAVELLQALRPASPKPDELVFAAEGKPLSNMGMAMLMRRMKVGEYTVHGFRSAFRDFAGDATDHPRDVAEAALAHAVGNEAERAYRRGRALEKRRALMTEWAKYLAGGGKVVPLRAAG